jgi:hypothetical protein
MVKDLLNDFSIQELESDTLFLNKTKSMYRYNPREIQIMTSGFSNKSAINFFVGKNKSEIFDFYLKEASGDNLINAVKILELLCISDSVEMSYKKYIIQALSRRMHTGKRLNDETSINSSYLFIIRYLFETNEIELFNQIYETHKNVLHMLTKTSWGQHVFEWAYQRTAELFLASSVEKLSSGGTVKYGHMLNDLSKFLINKYEDINLVCLPNINHELIKKVIFHMDEIRNETCNKKDRNFFGTTTTHIFTNSIEFKSTISLYKVFVGDHGLESLFDFTQEEILDLISVDRTGSKIESFKKELKAHIVKEMFTNHSEKIKVAINQSLLEFKDFLIEILPKAAELTSLNDHMKGDAFFKEKLSKYLNRDSHSSLSKKYNTMASIFKEYASIDDIADIYTLISSINSNLYTVPYFWAPNKPMNTSVLNPKLFLGATSIENKESILIDKILKNGGSVKLCGEIFSLSIRKLLNDKSMIEKDTSDTYLDSISKVNFLFGKYKEMLKEFSIESDIIRSYELYIFFATNCKHVIEFAKSNPVKDNDYAPLINTIFSKGKVFTGSDKDPVSIINFMVEEGVIDRELLMRRINIADGILHGLFDIVEVKRHILAHGSLQQLASTLEFFVKLMTDGECTFSKDIVEYMISVEFGKYIDQRFATEDKNNIKKWRTEIEKTMLSSGKLLPMSINEDEKNEKLRLMFKKHFNI